MPIENLVVEELPDCQSGYRPTIYHDDTVFDSGSANDLSIWPPSPPSRFNTNSPYVALGVTGVIIVIIIALLVAK